MIKSEMPNKTANPKRRNNEKRKEKSRDAARFRRTKEMQIFAELTAALPARREDVEQLDKASIMRLAISYLRVRDFVNMLPGATSTENLTEPISEISSELSYMKALDGFVLVLSQQGDIVYCSENITEHLGVSQMEIMGQSVFEFSHPCDHDEIRETLRQSSGGAKRDLLLRLKCTLTSKGRNVHLKSASYKVIHLTGHMLTPEDESSGVEKNNNETEFESKNAVDKVLKTGALVAVGRPIAHPSNIEIPLDSKTFLSKHSLDMKFTYTDDALQNNLGFEPADMVGRSLYDYHHAGDSTSLAQQFKSLFSKGQCETGQYRFLAKSGGFAWVQTQATVITDKQQKPTSVVCVNYVISGIECKDEIFAAHQLQYADLKPSVESLTPAVACANPANGSIVGVVPEDPRPKPATELIFAPRTKEMNKGFLTFSQDEGLTMLKDEPEDLTHLAPTAGDACIPLENSPFDMFDDFILSDNYCSLLGDDLANGSPVDSFTADSLLLSSPEPQESDSSCEQSSLLTELSLDAFESARSENELEGGKSPFIPTSDDMPLLAPAVMWGALPDNVSLARPQRTEAQPSPAPALQRLLATPPTGPPPQDIITNIYSDQGLIPSRTVGSWDTGVKRVLKQEEEPEAKRVKRSPTPPARKSSPSSSVLMNLLDLPQPSPQMQQQLHPNYRLVFTNTPHQLSSNPVEPIRTHLNHMLPKYSPRPNVVPSPIQQNNPKIMNLMTPLSLNVGSPMYSLPSSPNYSPVMSPAQRDRLMSPPQSISPIGNYCVNPNQSKPQLNRVLQTTRDPFLTNKMQFSPGLPHHQQSAVDMLLDSSLEAADFLMDPELLQGTFDILTALDDVKLV